MCGHRDDKTVSPVVRSNQGVYTYGSQTREVVNVGTPNQPAAAVFRRDVCIGDTYGLLAIDAVERIMVLAESVSCNVISAK